jgi:WD40 repeat protein
MSSSGSSSRVPLSLHAILLTLQTSTDRGVNLWDVRNAREILIPGLEHGGIESMDFSPDSQFLVVFDIDGPHSASTRVLRLDNLELDRSKIFRYSWKPMWPPFITFSPSGRVFLDVGSGSVSRLVETKTRRVLHTFDSIVFAYNAAFSADESYLAIATQDQEVLVYRTNNLKDGPVARLKPPG